jgi:hypothetical protein
MLHWRRAFEMMVYTRLLRGRSKRSAFFPQRCPLYLNLAYSPHATKVSQHASTHQEPQPGPPGRIK